MSYKRILVPVDGSTMSAAGMVAAMGLAKDSGAKLKLLHVVDEYPAFAIPDLGSAIGPMIDALREGGRRTLEAAIAQAESAGAAPESGLVENFGRRVADAIVEEARKWDADLIVMGTHGRRGVNRAIMGSDAELVVRTSTVPVLLIPPAKRVSPAG